MWGRGVAALVLAGCLAVSVACTLTIPIAAGVATSAHNRKVERVKAAGDEPALKKRSVGRNILAGLLVGAVMDVFLLYGAISSIELAFDDCE